MLSAGQRVEEVYHEALACPPERRVAVLEESCSGDAELRREVESLLAARDDAGDFLSPEGLHGHLAQLGPEAAAPSLGAGLAIMRSWPGSAPALLMQARDSGWPTGLCDEAQRYITEAPELLDDAVRSAA